METKQQSTVQLMLERAAFEAKAVQDFQKALDIAVRLFGENKLAKCIVEEHVALHQ
jgi:hypothetical protein